LTDANGASRDTQWIGKYGEKVAAAWLRSQRCRILATNFRGPRGGEIDIVARQGKLLLFVEVKTRRGNPKIRPFDAVNKEKIALIERGANAWLRQLGTRRLAWRFDVIEVLLDEGKAPQINQIKNAF